MGKRNNDYWLRTRLGILDDPRLARALRETHFAMHAYCWIQQLCAEARSARVRVDRLALEKGACKVSLRPSQLLAGLNALATIPEESEVLPLIAWENVGSGPVIVNHEYRELQSTWLGGMGDFEDDADLEDSGPSTRARNSQAEGVNGLTPGAPAVMDHSDGLTPVRTSQDGRSSQLKKEQLDNANQTSVASDGPPARAGTQRGGANKKAKGCSKRRSSHARDSEMGDSEDIKIPSGEETPGGGMQGGAGRAGGKTSIPPERAPGARRERPDAAPGARLRGEDASGGAPRAERLKPGGRKRKGRADGGWGKAHGGDLFEQAEAGLCAEIGQHAVLVEFWPQVVWMIRAAGNTVGGKLGEKYQRSADKIENDPFYAEASQRGLARLLDVWGYQPGVVVLVLVWAWLAKSQQAAWWRRKGRNGHGIGSITCLTRVRGSYPPVFASIYDQWEQEGKPIVNWKDAGASGTEGDARAAIKGVQQGLIKAAPSAQEVAAEAKEHWPRMLHALIAAKGKDEITRWFEGVECAQIDPERIVLEVKDQLLCASLGRKYGKFLREACMRWWWLKQGPYVEVRMKGTGGAAGEGPATGVAPERSPRPSGRSN